MRTACHHCDQSMDVPEAYLDRRIRCSSCHEFFVPNGGPAATPSASADHPAETPDDGPDWKLFRGVDTEHRLLVQMCEQARTAGKKSQASYLSAYCNAQTALRRDTWQAAAFEWTNARELLSEINNRRAAEQVRRTTEVFRQLASDQLIEFARELEKEFKQYNAHLPERAVRQQSPKIADSFRKLVSSRYRDLIDPAVVRQVERIANRWKRGHAVSGTAS